MSWSRDSLAASNDREIGDVDAVVAEDLFRDAFAFAQSQAGGAAPGESQALQREERGDILIERAIIPELVCQIKNHIRLECLQLLPEQIQVIIDREVLRGMAKLFERGWYFVTSAHDVPDVQVGRRLDVDNLERHIGLMVDVLAPDVRAAFPTDEAVNQALRSLMQAQESG